MSTDEMPEILVGAARPAKKLKPIGPRPLLLHCPRCRKGLGMVRTSQQNTKKTCKKCLDQWKIQFEVGDNGNVEITWLLLWSKWPIPNELKP